MTVLVIGILASLAVMNYQRSFDREYRRAARDILLAIYAGQKLYAILNQGQFYAPTIGPVCPTTEWATIFVEDPNCPLDRPLPVLFRSTADNTTAPPTLQATARYVDKCFSIDQSGTFTTTGPAAFGCLYDWTQ